MKTLQIALIMGLTAALSGCSTLQGLFGPPAKPALNRPQSASERGLKIQKIQRWRAQGAISIASNRKTHVGAFKWRQSGSWYQFQFSGPMNLAAWRLSGRPGHVELYQSADKRWVARTPEALMEKTLGWSMPLANFRYWSRGLAAPGIPANSRRDRFGHLIFLDQQGWQIHYLSYQASGNTDLPRKIVFASPRARLKIVIKKWQNQ